MLEEADALCMSAIQQAYEHGALIDPDTWLFSETTSEYKVSASHL